MTMACACVTIGFDDPSPATVEPSEGTAEKGRPRKPAPIAPKTDANELSDFWASNSPSQ